MKLSELKPEELTLVSGEASSADEAPKALKLSEIHPDHVTLVQGERGKQVYDAPVGPEQASPVDRFKERVSDPARWKAILTGEGPRAPKVAQGDVPLAFPGGALPRLAKAATALAEGQGLGWGAARTALSGAQGAAQAGLDGKDGESWQDKLDRATSGGKLSAGIQAAAESIPVVGKMVGAGARKIGSAISGEGESIVKNYSDRTDIVNDLIKQSGGDATQGADIVRREGMAGLQAKKAEVNGAISRALSKTDPAVMHDVSPIIQKLEAAKAKLNPNFKSGAISELDEMLSAIKAEAPEGKANLSSLYQIKQFLNEGSSSAYNKGGQIFTRASEAARAAKDAAGDARSVLKTAAPEISEADTYLSRLHRFERDLNKNILAEGKPDGALLAAGSDKNPRNAAKLKALENLSGVPFYQRAKDLATAKAFGSPAILPADYTGKAVARQAGAALLGTAVGGPVGGMVGGALASPMAVKLGVNAANVAGKVVKRIPGAALPGAIRRNPVAATAATQIAASHLRSQNEPTSSPSESAPRLMDAPAPKGLDKFAQQGLERLGITDHALKTQLMASKEGRGLLMEASKHKPNAPEMRLIKEQIKRGWIDRQPARTQGKGKK